MSKQDAINHILLAYRGRIPVLDLYYRYRHNAIAKRLSLKGSKIDVNSCLHNKVDIREISTAEKDAIIVLADKTLANEFNYLGSGWQYLDPVCWSKDFKSGFEWQVGTYYKKYNQVNLNDDADVKVPRELSRFHFLLHLALAYQFTGEHKYARKACDLIIDWIDHNPLMYSINWGCAMDVAIRAVNWIWALPLLKDYDVDKATLDKIYGSLYQHGWFIYHNFEGNSFRYNHNHYFSDLVGLIHIALVFKGYKQADKWLKYSLHAFYREVRLQVLPCGMSFEGSTNYHRLLLELTLPTVLTLKHNGIDVPPDIWGRLESMFDFVMNIMMPNGEVPIIGDQDNGRCLPWGAEDMNDERYLLSIGSILFDRGDMKAMGNGYNIYCAMFGGDNGSEKYVTVEVEKTILKSKLLRDAGFAILRRGNNYLLFNADNQGMYRDTGTSVSHTHCDWLSFVLVVNGVPFFIDPGTYVYSSDPKARNLFRSTKMHNTILVDGEDYVKIPEASLWGMTRENVKTSTSYYHQNNKDSICSTLKYSDKTIKREIEWNEAKVIFHDKVECKGNHNVESHLHLDVNSQVSIEGKKITIARYEAKIKIQLSSANDFSIACSDNIVSKSYGSKKCSKEILISGECVDEFVLTMIMDMSNE